MKSIVTIMTPEEFIFGKNQPTPTNGGTTMNNLPAFKQVEELIATGKIQKAINMTQLANDYHTAEFLAKGILEKEDSTETEIDLALQIFLDSYRSCPKRHYWVHSLSHFSEILWGRSLHEWIQKFNLISLKGAVELNDPTCSDRLVEDFAHYAKWNNDPSDFHLRMVNLHWMKWENYDYSKARIEAGKFKSEEAFLRWKVRQPAMYTEYDFDAHHPLINVDKILCLIQQLQELGADISELKSIERDLLVQKLDELKEKLLSAKNDWERKGAESGIQKTQIALDSLS